MRNYFKKIISALASFAIVISLLSVPAFAEEYDSRVTSLWDSFIIKRVSQDYDIPFVNACLNFIADDLSGAVCIGNSPDNLHHGSIVSEGELGGVDKAGQSYLWVKCKYCGDMFKGYASDLSAAYNDYVQTLPTSGYTSSGNLIWRPTFESLSDFQPFVIWGYAHFDISDFPYSRKNAERTLSFQYNASANAIEGVLSAVPGKYINLTDSFAWLRFVAPISGLYRVIPGEYFSLRAFNEDGEAAVLKLDVDDVSVGYSLGDNFTFGGYFSASSLSNVISTALSFYFPVYEIIPFTDLSADTYNITTRPTSISGGNYGIVGDNGQITKVEDNSTIVNETSNTYYNPATGTTVPIVNWSYDYSDRSYKVTLEGGDTATITYGDENITIQEGDTVYNIYYLIDGSGSENPPCEHDWQQTSDTDPTCTIPGKVTLTCTKCQQTKTESIPALGHNWQVKQTVTTQYDDTGQLVQQGYTIFECSLCHEQYKSTDGTAPPGGGSGSGTDPGGEEEGGGFLSWLFGKLGELLGTIGDGILNLLQTALDKIFGGLLDLINSLFENLSKLIDLFGSVGEAFQVLWTWLPPEVMAILVAGVSIFVFVALIKFFMK